MNVMVYIYSWRSTYSPGEGSVPCILQRHSRSTFPTQGLFCHSHVLGVNFMLSLTWPALVEAFQPRGASGYVVPLNSAGPLFVTTKPISHVVVPCDYIRDCSAGSMFHFMPASANLLTLCLVDMRLRACSLGFMHTSSTRDEEPYARRARYGFQGWQQRAWQVLFGQAPLEYQQAHSNARRSASATTLPFGEYAERLSSVAGEKEVQRVVR